MNIDMSFRAFMEAYWDTSSRQKISGNDYLLVLRRYASGPYFVAITQPNNHGGHSSKDPGSVRPQGWYGNQQSMRMPHVRRFIKEGNVSGFDPSGGPQMIKIVQPTKQARIMYQKGEGAPNSFWLKDYVNVAAEWMKENGVHPETISRMTRAMMGNMYGGPWSKAQTGVEHPPAESHQKVSPEQWVKYFTNSVPPQAAEFASHSGNNLTPGLNRKRPGVAFYSPAIRNEILGRIYRRMELDAVADVFPLENASQLEVFNFNERAFRVVDSLNIASDFRGEDNHPNVVGGNYVVRGGESRRAQAVLGEIEKALQAIADIVPENDNPDYDDDGYDTDSPGWTGSIEDTKYNSLLIKKQLAALIKSGSQAKWLYQQIGEEGVNNLKRELIRAFQDSIGDSPLESPYTARALGVEDEIGQIRKLYQV